MDTLGVKKDIDTIVMGVQCLNAHLLAQTPDFVELSKIHGTKFFMYKKVWKNKYKWRWDCAPKYKNKCFWHSKKSILFPDFIIFQIKKIVQSPLRAQNSNEKPSNKLSQKLKLDFLA